MLARWLATHPRFLILDEPTRGIDVGAKVEIEKLMHSLRDEGMAILFISSELEEVVRDSQRVIVLRDRAKAGELSATRSVRKLSCTPSRDTNVARDHLQTRSALVEQPDLAGGRTGAAAALQLAFTEGFFRVEVRDGRLYGVLIDILNHGSKVMLLALGMALVIATGGVDLSVGAVMAIAGAVAAQLINIEEIPFPVVIAAALGVALLAGAWNGLLVGAFNVQPIVATLILMVAGRGVAQLITGGQIITFTDHRLTYVGNGSLFGLPFPVLLSLGMLAVTILLTRKTAIGLFIESVGDNQRASIYAGVNGATVKFFVYVFSGFCAGLAGLVAASNIRCADANHAGLFLELDAILAVVVGGTALTGGRFYLAGAIVGALFIQTLTTTMYMRNVSADVAPVPKALAILAVCLLQSAPFRRKAAACSQKGRMKLPVSSKYISLLATALVLIALYTVGCVSFPNFGSLRVGVNLVGDNAFLGVAAVGATFVILSGGIDLSVGAVVAFTSILIASLVGSGMHPLVAISVALLIGAMFGTGMGCLIRWFELPPFLVTLAGMFLARGMGFVVHPQSLRHRTSLFPQAYH